MSNEIYVYYRLIVLLTDNLFEVSCDSKKDKKRLILQYLKDIKINADNYIQTLEQDFKKEVKNANKKESVKD